MLMTMPPTLQHMVVKTVERERHAAALAAQSVPRSQPGLLVRLLASIRPMRQPVGTPTVQVSSGAALQSVTKAGA